LSLDNNNLSANLLDSLDWFDEDWIDWISKIEFNAFIKSIENNENLNETKAAEKVYDNFLKLKKITSVKLDILKSILTRDVLNINFWVFSSNREAIVNAWSDYGVDPVILLKLFKWEWWVWEKKGNYVWIWQMWKAALDDAAKAAKKIGITLNPDFDKYKNWTTDYQIPFSAAYLKFIADAKWITVTESVPLYQPWLNMFTSSKYDTVAKLESMAASNPAIKKYYEKFLNKNSDDLKWFLNNNLEKIPDSFEAYINWSDLDQKKVLYYLASSSYYLKDYDVSFDGSNGISSRVLMSQESISTSPEVKQAVIDKMMAFWATKEEAQKAYDVWWIWQLSITDVLWFIYWWLNLFWAAMDWISWNWWDALAKLTIAYVWIKNISKDIKWNVEDFEKAKWRAIEKTFWKDVSWSQLDQYNDVLQNVENEEVDWDNEYYSTLLDNKEWWVESLMVLKNINDNIDFDKVHLMNEGDFREDNIWDVLNEKWILKQNKWELFNNLNQEWKNRVVNALNLIKRDNIRSWDELIMATDYAIWLHTDNRFDNIRKLIA
jgi:hypothetical protein